MRAYACAAKGAATLESSRSEKILVENLRLLAAEADLHAEKGRAMAAEAARMLAEPYVRATERSELFARAAKAFLSLEGLPTLSGEARVCFVLEALATFRAAGVPLLAEELLPLRTDIPERVSYFRTIYTDEAYDGFAAKMREPTVQYADAFFLSCEDVKMGDAGYCILPCENSEGPLPAMTATADRYELFRVGSYRAFHADGENATHFGLFSRAMPALPQAEALLLRFSATLEDARELALHLTALSSLGVGLLRSEVGAPIDDGALPCTLLCSLSQAELVASLLYLRIFAEQLSLRGLYEEIG